jgi:hypothetical protein
LVEYLYEVIVAPPSPFAVNAILIVGVDPKATCGVGDKVPIVGATGTVAGIVGLEAADAREVPLVLVAVTVKV